MFTRGQVVRLRPTTKRLKQLIRQHGRRWRCAGDQQPKPCFDGEDGVLIVSTQGGKHVRNVRLTDISPDLED